MKRINIITVITLITFYFLSMLLTDSNSAIFENKDLRQTENKECFVKFPSLKLGFLVERENIVNTFSTLLIKKINQSFAVKKDISSIINENKNSQYIHLLRNFPIKFQTIDIMFPFHYFW